MSRGGTAIRFPSPLYERLVAAADERDRSVNYMVVKAVEDSSAAGFGVPPAEGKPT